MKSTILDIARVANVSKATVSRVINNKSHGVSTETKARILQVIDEMGYVPNSQARSIVVSHTKTLGFVVPDISNPFFPQMVRSIVQVANRNGYTVFLTDSGNSAEEEEKYVHSLIEKRVDGIIFASAGVDSNVPQLCRHYNIPLVQIDRVVGEDGASVTIDNRKGMLEITRRLIENGHKNIAFLGGIRGVSTTEQRFAGYRDALQEAGISLRKEHMLFGDYSISSGMEMAAQMITSYPNITAMVACNDLIAIGAVKALRKKGILLPEQCEVTGFDGMKLADVFDPPITTVRQPIEEMSEEAAKLLIGMVNGTVSSNRHVVFEPILDWRSTTK